jgi:CBS domain-containing protein/gamma-glutamylcysteine synthetase
MLWVEPSQEPSMGEQNIERYEAADSRSFLRAIIRDLNALELMLDRGMFETDPLRIGAELEFVIVDGDMRPKPIATDLLKALASAPIDTTPELGKFNIEMNLPPLEFGSGSLRELERLLDEGMETISDAARTLGADTLTTGILPTLVQSDLDLRNMMDLPRYHALNDTLMKLRGGDFQFRIRGTDELSIQHASVMVETCNTSFQVHYQVKPDEFASVYNVAQLIAAPVLATNTNSPVLFGKRLWRETRIALFQQSLDLRKLGSSEREMSPRVCFGESWIEKSVVEIFREDLARHRVLLGGVIKEDPIEALEKGEIPGLDALRLHNGTVYRWNRPCYGVGGGKPHLRIENRLLPAGPTAIDAVATAAFWLGLLVAGPEAFGDIPTTMDIDEASANLTAAAYRGLGAHFTWLGGEQVSAPDLILNRLIPLSKMGLLARGMDEEEVERYLGVIKQRVETGLTGSQWILSSMAAMKGRSTKAEQLAAVTAGMLARQKSKKPVHSWDLATLEESGGWQRHFRQVGQYMSTDLYTVNQSEAIDLVACMMDWRRIRHVPVEDDDHRLVGLVTHRTLLRLIARGGAGDPARPLAVEDVMHDKIISVSPETPSLEAIELMKRHKIACLPVVRDERLVGMVTESDFLRIAAVLLEDSLREDDQA